MKKLINNPLEVVEDTIAGVLKAYPQHFRLAKDNPRALVLRDAPIKDKVSIVTGGGSGHLPVFLGYVGPGLADGVAIGNVFSSPSSDAVYAATREVNGGNGVLYLFGNYAGDSMSFDMARELAELDGIPVEIAKVCDDVASAPPEEAHRRRGVAGLFFAYKLVGAKAAQGACLKEVKATADRVISRTRSMGVALSPCTVPAAGKPTFSLGEDEMEIGMGIHGEPGVERSKMKCAGETAEIMVERILSDLPFARIDEVAVLVNGLGATPPEELYIIYSRVHDLLSSRGISIYRSFIGEYATSMEMAGCSVSLLQLDEELKALLAAPAFSPFLLQWGSWK
ncbi:MAG: dihydroxyacetone kinase subunit DhaK [Bacillota bacterium]